MVVVRRAALVGARKAAGYTQEGLAAELHVDRSTVVRWEAGNHAPLPYLWPQLARLLGQSPEQLRELIGDGSNTRSEDDGAKPVTGATCVDKLPPHVIPNRPNPAVLLTAPTEETIAYLGEQWHLLVRADNLFGPAHTLRLVHEQIELIEVLLRDASDGVRAPLLSLGAQYAESASWLHEDADDQLAPLWANRALEWAHAGNDQRLVVWALFRRSQQAFCDGDAAWSIGLVQAAQRTGGPLPHQMRAALEQQEACGLALDGDEVACHRKLDEALQWAESEPDRHGDARSGHGAFCTTTYIELQRADCWLRLGCPGRAVAAYETALADLPAAYHRDRGYRLAQFGSALVATNELEHATSVIREALGIARGCGSGRTMQRIRAVGGLLRSHAKLPSVARLLDELASVG